MDLHSPDLLPPQPRATRQLSPAGNPSSIPAAQSRNSVPPTKCAADRGEIRSRYHQKNAVKIQLRSFERARAKRIPECFPLPGARLRYLATPEHWLQTAVVIPRYRVAEIHSPACGREP